MKRLLVRSVTTMGLGLLAMAPALAPAANWSVQCIDPENEEPYDNPVANGIANSFWLIRLGGGGSVTYGGEAGPCFAPGLTLPFSGKFTMSVGSVGSIQQSSQQFTDQFMSVMFGAPNDPVYAYANITTGGTRNFWGAGFSSYFVGFSNRYMSATSVVANISARLQMEMVADAVRFRWNLTNAGTEELEAGLMFGSAVCMLADNDSNGGARRSHWQPPLPPLDIAFSPRKVGYTMVDAGRPPITDRLYSRATDPVGFPDYVNFLFGQTDAFGLRVDTGPVPATADVPQNNPTQASNFWLGKAALLLGAPEDPAPVFPTGLLPDTEFYAGTGFVVEYPEAPLAPGASRQILYYLRSPWGEGDYRLPFGAVVDAPKLIQTRATDFNGNPTNGGIFPNPMNIRVTVDNVGGFAFDEREIRLQDVRITLAFQPNAGITVAGASQTAPHLRRITIAEVPPHQERNVTFQATLGPDVTGNIPYTVTIEAQPGTVVKTINGIINVAARPRLTLLPDANFITAPYEFSNSSWNAVLANFIDPQVPGARIRAYRWSPTQEGYVISESAQRGESAFVVYEHDQAVTADMEGQPTTPFGFSDDEPIVQLHSGWNMIANPYNYAIPIDQLIGVNANNNQVSHTFRSLIQQGWVSGFLTYYDPATDDYVIVDALTGMLEPNRGYWLLVLTVDDLSLAYPPVFAAFRPDSGRKPVQPWQQSDNQWRLQLVARTQSEIDAENYVGVATGAKASNSLRVFEAPAPPNKNLALAIETPVNGRPTRVSQAMSERNGRNTWKVVVDVKEPGEVTVTWPNIGTTPRSMRYRIKDVATGTTTDMRRSSGYTFTMNHVGTREFTVSAEQGGSAVAVIGNVVVHRDRDLKGPISVSYTLSTAATTSVRVLNSNGREVYSITRGRADGAGENTVVWNLRNSANQAVAPGAYRVEILAETADGERVRKIVPVNVVR